MLVGSISVSVPREFVHVSRSVSLLMPGKRYKRKGGGGGGGREEKKRKTDGETTDSYTEIIKDNSSFEAYYKVTINFLFPPVSYCAIELLC